MVSFAQLLYLVVHPKQLRSVIEWTVWHKPLSKRNTSKESKTLSRSFVLLSMTSRSFSAVVQELGPELFVPVVIFYLALRGLDTIEDDMTIPLEIKEPLLRNFHNFLEKDGWTFTGSGPAEKDRDLLVEFDNVVTEYSKIKPAYKDIIKNITLNMGNGMANYVRNDGQNFNGINTIADYELYCHYVAGLVGDGLTKLFVEAKLADHALLERPQLFESMGQLLQKTNIIRDVHEDFDDRRRFWPREIWSKHVEKYEDLFHPSHLSSALACSSEMVLDSLKHVDGCLLYLASIKDQGVFNFVTIPQAMAMATLELVFQNPAIFEKNVKISKGDACQIMIESSQNLRMACGVFRTYVRRINRKNSPKDPKFAEIATACEKIDNFIGSMYPSQESKLRTRLLETPAINKRESSAAIPEERREVMYLAITAFRNVLVISALIIGVAYLATGGIQFSS